MGPILSAILHPSSVKKQKELMTAKYVIFLVIKTADKCGVQ